MYMYCLGVDRIIHVYVVGQNEIQVKIKFLCLLTLIIQGS